MKKIFILSMLIAPIVAYATGPAGVDDGFDGDWVGADDVAPYETATIENGDSTTVVSASYVKGAYNDTITAINTVANDVNNLSDSVDEMSNSLYDKQDKLYYTNKFGTNYLDSAVKTAISDEVATAMDHSHLASVGAIRSAIDAKRISAVTTWGNDTPTQLQLSTASN